MKQEELFVSGRLADPFNFLGAHSDAGRPPGRRLPGLHTRGQQGDRPLKARAPGYGQGPRGRPV